MSLKLQIAFVALVQNYLFIRFSLVIRKEGDQQECMGNIFRRSYSPSLSLHFCFIGCSLPVSNLSKKERTVTVTYFKPFATAQGLRKDHVVRLDTSAQWKNCPVPCMPVVPM